MRRWKRERHRARIEKLASSSGGNGGPKTAGNGTAEADDKGEKERNLLDAVEELSAAEYFMASALAKIGATGDAGTQYRLLLKVLILSFS